MGVTGSNMILSQYETDITQFEFTWNVWDTFLCIYNHKAGERTLSGQEQEVSSATMRSCLMTNSRQGIFWIYQRYF